jgi:8-amino-7-oxononanoate synthase
MKRKKLTTLIEHFQKEAIGLQLPVLKSSTPIQAIMVPSNERVLGLSSYLKQNNYCCLPIRAPTVPIGSERIRIIIHSHNSEKEISDMCRLIKNFLAISIEERKSISECKSISE